MILGASQQQLHKGTHLVSEQTSYYWNSGWGTSSGTSAAQGLDNPTMHPSKRGMVGGSAGTRAGFRYWTNGTYGTTDTAGATLISADYVDVNASGTYMVTASSPEPALRASSIDIDAVDGSQVVSSYNPASSGSVNIMDPVFGPAETDVVSVSSGNPSYLQAWAWSNSTQWGSKRSNSSDLNTALSANGGQGTRFSPFGNAVFSYVGGSNGTPWVFAHAYTEGTGFGTKFANISATSLTVMRQMNVAGSAATAQKVLCVGYGNAPIIINFSSSTGFGTKVTSPSGMPVGQLSSGINKGLQLGSGGTDVVYSSDANGQVVYTYTNASGFGTKYADPSPTVSAMSTWSR